jgi:pimeloyl-ACP methyl ester carboxylesterase
MSTNDAHGSTTRVEVVAVHGNGGGAFRFSQVHSHLPTDVRLHAVTLPGFANRPRDPSLRTLRDYADQLANEFADLDRPVLLGHGIGGSMALDLVARRPELVSGLILHSPVGASLDTRLFPRIMSTSLVRRIVQRGISSKLPRPLLRRVFFPHGAPKAVLDEFFNEYRTCQSFGQMFDVIDRPWFDSVQPVAEVPTVVLWGADDRVLKSGQSDDIAAKVPGAEVIVRDGWDHFPMIEQPADYATVIVDLARRLHAAR